MKRPVILAAAIALAIVALGVAGVILRRPPGEKHPDVPVANGPIPTARAADWSTVEIPAVAGGGTEMDRLRRKIDAGRDRFTVEVIDEKIESRLGVLAARFRDPASGGDPPDFLADTFRASPWRAPRTERLLAGEGIEARRSVALQGDGHDRSDFLAGLVDLIRPVTVLDRVKLKVIHIAENDDDNDDDVVASTVLYALAGGDASGGRREWNGTARLRWRRKDWSLLEWRTLESFESRLDGPPFEDVTRRAFGDCPSFGPLLARSLDHFRERIEEASGIAIYGHHGVSVADVDGDGLEDIYVAMPAGLPNLLYRATPDGRFEDISSASGSDAIDGTSQALVIDLDGDRDRDIFLVLTDGLVVLLNDGKARFRELPVAVKRDALGQSAPHTVAAADYDGDGDLDLYVGSYVFWRGTVHATGSSLPIPYHDARNGAPNILLRNRGDGHFENVTPEAGLDVGNDRFTFAVSWGDYDDDGDPDLYVANDFGSNNLYRNLGDGTFEEVSDAAGVRDLGPGMSATWEDVDGDADLDLYVGNMFSSAGQRVTGTETYREGSPRLREALRRHARGNSLYLNQGDGTFVDASLERRANFGRWAWSSGFIDFNLDGREDIYVQNGFISQPSIKDL